MKGGWIACQVYQSLKYHNKVANVLKYHKIKQILPVEILQC